VKDSANAAPAAGKVTIGNITESGTPGVYTATLRGQLAETFTVTPQFSGSAIGTLSDTVTLTANATPDGTQSTFAASPKTVVADDVATSTLTLTVKDRYGNVIPGIASSLTMAGERQHQRGAGGREGHDRHHRRKRYTGCLHGDAERTAG
jgi:hypothetical protein